MRKIIVLGIAKNIERHCTILKDCLRTILDLGDTEKNSAYLYENNSTDSTVERLQQMAKDDPRIHVKTEILDSQDAVAKTWDNQPSRIECIGNARNKCMDFWESSDKEDAVVIWLDLDRVHRIDDPSPIEFLTKQLSLAPPNTISGFFPFSTNHKGDMYDTFSYRDTIFALGPEILGEDWWSESYQSKLHSHLHAIQESHISVLSAFNGIGLYRSEAIRGLRFTAFPNTAMEKYYRTLWRSEKHPSYKEFRASQENVQTHHNGCLLGRYVFGKEGTWYRNNSGYSQPIVCEWVPFHFEMIDRGWPGLFLIKAWRDVSGH